MLVLKQKWNVIHNQILQEEWKRKAADEELKYVCEMARTAVLKFMLWLNTTTEVK
jgi:hypothetical protein